jgi:D-serine deaminase-like pyridoxal phosphate-dependent protein
MPVPLAPLPAGTPVDAVDTPALVVDLDAMERNLRAMAAFAAARGVRLRPHAKMHKCAAIARLQVAAGAVGVCVQKTSEAEAMAAGGIDDIYISNEVVDPAKLDRVAALAGRVRLAIAVDSEEGIDRLAAATRRAGTAVSVFVEVDVGHGRCGVAPDRAGALARRAVDAGLAFAGLQAYHGSAQHLASVEARRDASRHAARRTEEARDAVGAAGLACPLVTGSGTGTVAFDAEAGPWGEWQAGSYLFMDREYADLDRADAGPRFEHALFVKCQVMSRAATHVVVDAGHKAFALDAGPPRVVDRPLAYRGASDEHAVLVPLAGATLPAIGETVWLVPGHCDPTVNLHDRYVALRGGRARGVVEATWTVDARGALT